MKTWVSETRNHLHEIAELSMEEFATTQFIINELEQLNISYDTPLNTGVVAYIQGTTDHAIAFRADIDALPLLEKSTHPTPSKNIGIMHACGHDGHTAILLGFIKHLTDLNQPLKSTVYFIFQPSEETMAGANQLINHYHFTPVPEHIFGMHMMPDNEEGLVLSKQGVITASATEYRFFIEGLSSHVANKDQGQAASEALLFILNHVSQIQHYHLPGLHRNIVHIGQFNAGEAINTVPSSGYLEGTIRTYDLEDLKIVQQQMNNIQAAAELISNCKVTLKFEAGYPPTNNNEKSYALYEKAVSNTPLKQITLKEPYLFGEDFSFYNTVAPTTFMFLGCRNEQLNFVHGLHTPQFNFNNDVLMNGIELYIAILNEFEGQL